ncbi:MAG: transglycosylase SLT domain-containing protein [Nitrospirales bacterium]|nr:transglycosylase SLT domain-containing protein [Nitrospirales bacterium]
MRLPALIMILLLTASVATAEVPRRAYRYFPVLREEHQRVWPEGDIHIIAEQINHESGWRRGAVRREKSGVVSYGALQVLDRTFLELKKKYPEALYKVDSPADMLQARWGIRAGILYDRHLWSLVSFAADMRERYAMMLSAYNGGYGWLLRDRKLAGAKGADPDRWFGNVERFSQRSGRNFIINRRYAREILSGAVRYKGLL